MYVCNTKVIRELRGGIFVHITALCVIRFNDIWKEKSVNNTNRGKMKVKILNKTEVTEEYEINDK